MTNTDSLLKMNSSTRLTETLVSKQPITTQPHHVRPKVRTRKPTNASNTHIYDSSSISIDAKTSQEPKAEEDLDALLSNIRQRMTTKMNISNMKKSSPSVCQNNTHNTTGNKSQKNTINKQNPPDGIYDSSINISESNVNENVLKQNAKNERKLKGVLKQPKKKFDMKKAISTDSVINSINVSKKSSPTASKSLSTVSLIQSEVSDENDNINEKEKTMKLKVIERPVCFLNQDCSNINDASKGNTNDLNLFEAQIFAASNIEGYHAALIKKNQEVHISNDVETSNSSKKFSPYGPYLDLFDSDTDTTTTCNDDNSDDYDHVQEIHIQNENDLDSSCGDSEEEIDSEPETETKSFILLWQALSTWVTPQTVELVQTWQKIHGDKGKCTDNTFINLESASQLQSPVDRSDIGASRCAGLMSMFKMHLPKCLEEFFPSNHNENKESNPNMRSKAATTQPHEHLSKRIIEQRLSNLCLTFDYSQPMKYFNFTPTDANRSKLLWRALCCILLHIVIGDGVVRMTTKSKEVAKNPDDISFVPNSVLSVGLGRDEYRYLVKSAITSLGNGISQT